MGGSKNMSEKYGIIGAMDHEVAALAKQLENRTSETIAGMEFFSGSFGDTPAVVVKCGMGKVNAGICAHTLINRYGVTAVINTGAAGSLDNRIEIGDMVVSTDAVQHDFDVSPIGFQKGEIPYTGLYAFAADEDLRKRAEKAIAEAVPEVHVFPGRIASGDQFIASHEQKETIVREFGALCCEMEGAAIAQVCYLNRTPFVIIRAISDKADGSAEMSFDQFAEAAAKHGVAAVHRMLKQ